MRQAQSSEPPVQRLANRLAVWLVYLALAGAALTFLVTRDLPATISVVVVAGAYGIAAGTPLAVLASIARIDTPVARAPEPETRHHSRSEVAPRGSRCLMA